MMRTEKYGHKFYFQRKEKCITTVGGEWGERERERERERVDKKKERMNIMVS